MKRNIVDVLIKWNNDKTGKPLLLTGVKGVGKTYLAYDFAKAFFERIYYVNFEREPGREAQLRKILFDDVTNESYDKLREYFKIEPEFSVDHYLLILDEISYTKDFPQMLKVFEHSGVFPRIICISSNPIAEKSIENFQHLSVHPMEFDEFLLATANEWYIETIRNHFESNKQIPDIVHKELLTLFHLYLQIGGMPGVLNEYLNFNSVINIPEQHEKLVSIYHDTIITNHPESDALKMNQIIDSIPLQLSKDNKKFQFKQIRKGTTFTMYKTALQSLTDCNYIIRCNKVSTEQLLDIKNTYSSTDWFYRETNFKIYLPDIGLLYTKMMHGENDNPSKLNDSSYKGLLENYVAQSLYCHGYQIGFWESSSMARIDYLIMKANDLIPIEIHTSDNTRSKSISILKNIYPTPYAVKISSKNFEFSNQVKYVPYYSVFCL